MKKILRNFSLLIVLALFGQAAFAQSGFKGVIKDSQTGETLIGANVVIDGTTEGTATDLNGRFKMDKEPGDYTVTISYTGYDPIAVPVKVSTGQYTDLGNIKLDASAIGLAGVSIIADRARERETPVAFSNLNKQEIEEQLGSRDIPLAMDVTPNVYATMQGGGAGDARINVRGFNQRNVAIMINGVPVNDMENGWVYWSNWDGVGDATSSIQMQRGLSAVNLATPSIGGTMNVITSPAEQKGGITYKQEFGSGNFIKSTVFAHTGQINGKYAISVGGVRKTGEGVIDATWTDAWAYYFGASYNINSKNRLEIFAVGAPQRHGQNLYKQNIGAYSKDYAESLDDYDPAALDAFPEAQRGRLYNETWGPLNPTYYNPSYSNNVDNYAMQNWNGKYHERYSPHFMNERENYYHKPLINLNWYSQFSDDVSLFTTAYYSGGKGGGTGTYGSLKWDYSGPSRFIDFDKTIANNDTLDGSAGILRNSVNNQWTVGLISKLRWNVNEKFKMQFGIDGRTAQIEHYYEVRDLLGGNYYYRNDDDFETADADHRKMPGDKFNYFNTNNVDWLGGFIQGEYNYGNVTAYGMAGYSMIKYKYTNHFATADTLANGDPDVNSGELVTEADWIAGYQVKGGLSYRFTETLMGFANVGYVSKVPIFDYVIDDGTGTKAENPENEKFTSIEIGANYTSLNSKFTITGNYYYTLWKDRALSLSYQDANKADGIVFITGMEQKHSGFEVEGTYRPIQALGFLFAGSVNNWTYTKDVSGVYKDYSDANNPDVEYNFYTKDLKVGDAPQTQFALGLTVYPAKGLKAQLVGKYYANHYADWDPFSRTTEDDREQVWKTPSYTVFDFHGFYDLPLNTDDVKVQVFVHIFNLFDEIYVQDAVDNSSFNAYRVDGAIVNPHMADAAEVYLGLPRTFNFGVMVNL
ncbi:MAG: TonB-dependent receptor [Bacteroidales bacterium]|nr:TonB-dependent receptor [Bacteroidales bacterium]